MKPPPWHEQPLAKVHDRARFDCGVEALNAYLRRFARQNHESGGGKTFVATPDAEPARILGYYTIAPGSIAYARVPRTVTHRLGHYDVPVFRLGRLAVAIDHQGEGLGAQLLLSAGERALSVASVAGGVALAIDAKDERAATWYEGFGAMRLLDDPRCLVLPLQTIAEALAKVPK